MKLIKLNKMKKLLLLLSFPLMAFQCDVDDEPSFQQMQCECILETAVDNGRELIMQPNQVVSQTYCDNSLTNAMQRRRGTNIWFRYIEKCN